MDFLRNWLGPLASKNFFGSMQRNLYKFVLLFAIGLGLYLLAELKPLLLGPTLAPLAYSAGQLFLCVFGALLAMCILDPHVSSARLIEEVEKGNQAAGLAFIGRCLLFAAMILVLSTSAKAQDVPAAALPKLPIVKQELAAYWPSLANKAWIPGQMEKESCIHLKHSRCWNERSELRTARERGVGLGQFTKAFHPDGSVRFDALSEIRMKYPRELVGFTWENPYDTTLQVRAVVLKMRDLCARVNKPKTENDRMRMCLVAYNGGEGGLKKDQVRCSATPGCDASVWYGNVELTSGKSKAPMAGYGGQSPYSISRKYPREIEFDRMPRYVKYMV